MSTPLSAGYLPFDVVDVFTDTAYAGNPLAVVRGTAGCTDAQLLAIAREFNLSETAFPWPVSEGVDADYRLRICTPSVELPFAGHPSVGAAWVLRSHEIVGDGLVHQECGAGVLPLVIDGDEVTLTGGAPTLGPVLPVAEVAAAVGLGAADCVLAPRSAGTGLEFTYLIVDSAATVDRCAPVAALLTAFGAGGISVSSWSASSPEGPGLHGPGSSSGGSSSGGSSSGGSSSGGRSPGGRSPGGRAYTRVFAGGVGVDEDPATGSAALGFGVFAAAAGLIGDGSSSITITQGVAMGRASTLHVTVEVGGGVATEVRVRGGVIPIASGTIRVPPGA